MKWENKKVHRFTLRVPTDLHRQILVKIESSKMPMSLNDYIVKTLLKSLNITIA